MILAAFMTSAMTSPALCADWPGKKSVWNGADRYDFRIADRGAIMVVPEKPLKGNPWVWRPAFFDAFPSIDKELLQKGYHIAYLNVTDEWGRPQAIRAGKEFYDFAVAHGLMDKVVMEGLSRGGFYSLQWAETYPELIGALILDNPLVDLDGLKINPEWYADVLRKWNEDSIAAPEIRHNAVNNLTPLVEHRVPILLLSGGADSIVPFKKHGKIIKDTYERWNVPMKSIVRPHSGHHPHGLDNPTPAADYITRCLFGDSNDSRPLRVACIGDSMTEGVGTDDFSTQSYPAVLQSLLGERYEVGNFGVSCATMLRNGTDAGRPFGYAGLPAMKRALDWNPDIVIIALGVNDCKSYNWGKYSSEFVADYQDFIDSFRMLPSLPEIYLVIEPYVHINPQTRSWGFDDKGYYEQMISLVNTLACDNGIGLIDLQHVFRGERVGAYAPNDHPNQRGAYMMARLVCSSIAGER